MTAATESLAAWARRVAPTLDAAGWRQADAIANRRRWPGPQDFTINEARALLAERDRVAAGLSEDAANLLIHRHRDGWIFVASHTGRELYESKAVARWSGVIWVRDITDFGREIARVLAERTDR